MKQDQYMSRTCAREAHREVAHTWVNVAGGKAAGSSSASGVVLHSALAHMSWVIL